MYTYAEYTQMSTHIPGFLIISRFFASSGIGKISQQQQRGSYRSLCIRSGVFCQNIDITDDLYQLRDTDFKKIRHFCYGSPGGNLSGKHNCSRSCSNAAKDGLSSRF